MLMRNISRHILLCFILALRFCFAASAFPQGDSYDRALDKYARICDRCVELRMRVESGQSVQMEELKSLLAELSSLRKTLSNASGKMTMAQSARFEEIKNKYLQGMKSVGEKPSRPVLSHVPRIVPVTEPVEVKPATELVEVTSQEARAGALRQAQRPDGQAQRPGAESQRLDPQRQRSSYARYSKSLKFAIMADAGIFPTPSYGAMAVVTWNGFGAYVNYRSNFRKNEYSYTCTSDGVTEYGSIWATGNSRESRTAATAGLAVFPSHRFGFYAGAGLTSYRLCWEDASREWVNVEDKSFKNLAVDAGFFVNVKPLILSLGVNTDFFGHADLQLGVGISF